MSETELDQIPTPTTTVYISNLSEDVWPFIMEMSRPGEKEYEIEENANLSDRHLLSFAGEDNIIFILPRHPQKEFLNYYLQLFENKNIRILVPKKHTGEICKDILSDSQIMNFLRETAAITKRFILKSYTTSPQFLHLIKILRYENIPVYTPEAPEEQDAWTVNFYGSKSGIRQLAQQSATDEPDLKMAPGLISYGIYDAAKIAAKTYIKEGGVVLKTNKGHSGVGILIYRPGDLPTNFLECEEKLLKQLRQENYWGKFPIIIENYITINTAIGGGCPNVEFKILKSGKVEFLYSCGMRITNKGVFKGIEINNEIMSDKVTAQIMDTGFFVGEKYASQGYRGYYELDFVAARNGEIYVTESNVRRTGGTHVYHIAKQLFGDDFIYNKYTLSNDIFEVNKPLTFSELYEKLKSLLFDKVKGEGIIITDANLLSQNRFSYVIFGKTEKCALEIETQMERLMDK